MNSIISLISLNVNHEVSDSVHRIFCIDVSGSMSSELPDIRRQLKNKLPTSIRPQDFMSLIWFSGRGQFGSIFEHISINDLKDLTNINTAIDRYINTIGSTGFVEPIRLAKKLSETYPEQSQVFFLTDGGENTWSQQECMDAFKEMSTIPLIIVEYQYYCDRIFLQKLAEISNGTCVFNENFESYDVSFDNYMSNKVSKMKTVESKLPIMYMDGETFVTKLPTNDIFRIPEHVERVWKIDTTIDVTNVFTTDERIKTDPTVNEMYMLLLYCLQTKKFDIMEKCVNVLGDVYVSKLFSTCFSKQDASRLYNHILNCVNDTKYAFHEGVDTQYIVKNDVFTIVDLLQLLQNDPKSRYYPYHHSIKYNRISKENKDTSDFIPNRDLGASFNLVYHHSRANISMGCQIHGHEDGEHIKPVTSFRNYTIIKDGIKNMDTIAVSFSEQTFNLLKSTGSFVLPDLYEKKVYLLDLKNLPVVNRLFMKVSFNSDEFCYANIDLLYQKSHMKYVNKIKKDFEKVDKEVEKDNSFVKSEQTIVHDFYIAKELQVKIAKCSTIPTINEKLITKLDQESKLTLSESLLVDIHKEYKSINDESIKMWITEKQEELKKRIHDITTFLEKAKMAILIGGCWFSNCPDTEKTFSVTYMNKKFDVTIEMKEINVYTS